MAALLWFLWDSLAGIHKRRTEESWPPHVQHCLRILHSWRRQWADQLNWTCRSQKGHPVSNWKLMIKLKKKTLFSKTKCFIYINKTYLKPTSPFRFGLCQFLSKCLNFNIVKNFVTCIYQKKVRFNNEKKQCTMFTVHLGLSFYVFLSNNTFWVAVIIKIIKLINFICYVLCILVSSYCFAYKIKKKIVCGRFVQMRYNMKWIEVLILILTIVKIDVFAYITKDGFI